MKLRHAAGVLGLCAIAFVLGVLWLQTKAFPYTQLSQLDSLVFFKKRVVGSVPVLPAIAESQFSGLKIDNIPLDEKFPVQHNGGGIDVFGNNVIILGKNGGLFLYRGADQ